MKSTLTQERLKELLHYGPETGVFTRVGIRRGYRTGTIAGHQNKLGYVSIRMDDELYQAHRLAYLYMTASWPVGVVDHINGRCSDNRWSNLRDTTVSVNAQNQKRARVDNKVGLLGVHSIGKRFRSVIKTSGKQTYLGIFDTPDQAHQAYLTAKRNQHAGCTI